MMTPTFFKTGFFLLTLPHLQVAWAQTVSCSFEFAADSGDTCESFASSWGLSVETFESLNPSVTCPDLVAGENYCISGTVTGGSTTSSSSTASPTSTSSAPDQPQQTGTAANCDKFYLVQAGDSCQKIESQFDITADEFLAWNPSINDDCTNILAGYYYCVDVPGVTKPATTTTAPATTTTPANGITTPTPYQTGMVGNCNEFYLVKSGDSCAAIASNYNIPLSTFYAWNPAVGSSCAYLYLGDYVCVDIIGYTPITTTSTGNGITTPTPYEPGMVDDCKKFYLVQSGDTCEAIASSQGVSADQIEEWNSQVGSSCSNLWLGDYICVGV